nr:hypothetical protein [Sphingobium sp. AS12]
MFDQNGIGVFAEHEGRAFKRPARLGDFNAQLLMRVHIAGKAGNVVNYDDWGILSIGPHISQHVFHAGAREQSAGLLVGEHRRDVIVAEPGILTAAGFLTIETIAFPVLLRVADTTVNYRLL